MRSRQNKMTWVIHYTRSLLVLSNTVAQLDGLKWVSSPHLESFEFFERNCCCSSYCRGSCCCCWCCCCCYFCFSLLKPVQKSCQSSFRFFFLEVIFFWSWDSKRKQQQIFCQNNSLSLSHPHHYSLIHPLTHTHTHIPICTLTNSHDLRHSLSHSHIKKVSLLHTLSQFFSLLHALSLFYHLQALSHSF